MVERPHQGIVLIGGGGHALVVAETLGLLNIPIAGVLDDRADAPAITRLNLPHLGSLATHPAAGTRFLICLGDVSMRERVLEELGNTDSRAASAVISPRAYVSPTSTLGEGVFVGPMAVVHSFARIEAHAIINTGAIVEHDCRIGRNAHIAPGSVVAGAAIIGEASLLGVGCRIVPECRIGSGCTVGAGAVVIRDVPSGMRVAGVPARTLARPA